MWPFAFDIADFQPITGRIHQPPPVHQTFQARIFVVCSFVPRKFDYHPLAIPAPYNHSNINSDEVIYYVAGNFMSRRGVGISSFTLHPAGIPHGPHPGTAEASIGKEATEELAVMVDTFHPLKITRQAAALEDASYPYSRLPPRTPPARPASSRARTGGVPGLTQGCAEEERCSAAGRMDLDGVQDRLDLGMQRGILDDGFHRVDDDARAVDREDPDSILLTGADPVDGAERELRRRVDAAEGSCRTSRWRAPSASAVSRPDHRSCRSPASSA